MIRTNVLVRFKGRDIRKGIVQLEISDYRATPQGITYTVIDYEIITDEDGNETKIGLENKTVFYDVDKINALNEILDSQNDYSEMTKMEREWAKVVDGLLFDTQNNLFEEENGEKYTVYGVKPEDWVKC